MALKHSASALPTSAESLKSGNVANIFLHVMLTMEKLVTLTSECFLVFLENDDRY